MERFELHTRSREEMVLITGQLEDIVRKKKWQNGALLVFCPHTTGAITINEAADPDVQADICRYMGKLVPRDPAFAHMEGNSDSHIKTSLFGPHCLLIVDEGQIKKGTWQGVYFCEWDGPRSRNIWVQFLPGAVVQQF